MLTLISSRPSPLFGFEVVKAFSSSGREMLELHAFEMEIHITFLKCISEFKVK